jgi:signal peptidase I
MRRLLVLLALLFLLAVAAAGCGHAPGLPHDYVQQSGSMEPTIRIGQRIRTWPLPEQIERGSILVVRFPGDHADFVKRVVGLPGEQVAAVDGNVLIDDRPLAEPYLPQGVVTESVEPLRLGPDQYYLLGDNRTNSNDSRFKGPLTRAQMVALVKL